VLGAWDRDNDVIYVVDAIRMHGLAANHVARIKEHPMRLAPVAWPHDGGKGAGIVTGETIAATYKKLGLNMRPTMRRSSTAGSGSRPASPKWRSGSAAAAAGGGAPAEWFDEYLGYHRVNGLVHKVDDDLLSATRVLCMDIRHAKVVDKFAPPRGLGGAGARSQLADGVDFDLHR
jgi:hypothetical protein